MNSLNSELIEMDLLCDKYIYNINIYTIINNNKHDIIIFKFKPLSTLYTSVNLKRVFVSL